MSRAALASGGDREKEQLILRTWTDWYRGAVRTTCRRSRSADRRPRRRRPSMLPRQRCSGPEPIEWRRFASRASSGPRPGSTTLPSLHLTGITETMQPTDRRIEGNFSQGWGMAAFITPPCRHAVLYGRDDPQEDVPVASRRHRSVSQGANRLRRHGRRGKDGALTHGGDRTG